MVIDTALEFAKLGYYVFPLYKGKNGARIRPYGWARNIVSPDKQDKAIPATSDVEVVAKWAETVKAAYGSVVLSFGILGNTVVILDLDIKDGKDGIKEFGELSKKYKIPTPTMATVTKSGGLHLFYRKPKKYMTAQIKTVSGVQADGHTYEGIDLRGDGGFVVGPDIFENDLKAVPNGIYGTRGLMEPSQLPEFPEKLFVQWLRVSSTDTENLMGSPIADSTDIVAQVRRGILPESVPKGRRNEVFFALVSFLKSKDVPIEVTRISCQTLAERCEEPDTLAASVDVEDMIKRAYAKTPSDPFSVARDLVSKGLFQLSGFKGKIHYAILEDNPYIQSRIAHDEPTIKTLLKKYERPVEDAKGKPVLMNPITIVAKDITDMNRVDVLGFKPLAGQVFTLADESGSRRFLNTYRPIDTSASEIDEDVWNEFSILMARLFGETGSKDYQMGMDFIAWLIQRPNIKLSIAPFLMSSQRGVGKSLLFNVLSSIMGSNKVGEKQARMVKLDEISGRFFDPSGCVVNLIDEAQFPVHRGMRQESTQFWRNLKTLVTAETVSVEIKGGITYQSPNTAAIMLAGNSGASFPIEEMDRRIWVIDNNAPILEMGVVDRLFDLVRRTSLSAEERLRYVSTLRHRLANWKIQNDLASLRAPMTEIKRELWLDSLTDTAAWFEEHFSDAGNLFAHNRVVSQSALYYVWIQSGRENDKDTGTFFRDLKRKGQIKPIRTGKGSSPSKQFTVPTINQDGTRVKSDKREVLYTTGDHGSLDGADTETVLDLFETNCGTIGRWKQQQMTRKKALVAAGVLTGQG